MAGVEWVTWDGGPHLLLPERALADWEGGDPPSGGRIVKARFRYQTCGPATDYDRACDVDELVGKIDVGGYDALVLGDEVPMSRLVRDRDGSLCVFIPMVWNSPDSFRPEALEAIVEAASQSFVDTGLIFNHPGGRLVLQPAAVAGKDVEDRLMMDGEAGRYHVQSASVRSAEGEFRAHRLSYAS